MNACYAKVQYKKDEIGEFSDREERPYEEIIELIEHFPWKEQRQNIVINLTNPSVTIENPNDAYLKLAVYFNNKYVLHYYDSRGKLYTKSFVNIQDSYPVIKEFVNTPDFVPDGFREEHTLFQNNLKHFVSKEFEYDINSSLAWRFLFSTSSINLLFGLATIIFCLFCSGDSLHHMVRQNTFWDFVIIIVIVLELILFAGGLNLALFFNYLLYAKGKVLILSKGNDIFYYGPKEHPIRFDKKDIASIVIRKNSGYRSPVNGFAVFNITFHNGEMIKIPNIFVGTFELEQKFSSIPPKAKNTIPFIS